MVISIFHLEVAGDAKSVLIDSLAITAIIEIDNAIGTVYWELIVVNDEFGLIQMKNEGFF